DCKSLESEYYPLHFENYPDKEISLKQIAVADTLLLNKAEKLDDKQKEQLYSKVKSINPLSEIFFAEYGIASGFDLHKISHRHYSMEPSIHSHHLMDSKTIYFHQPLNKDEFIRRLEYMLDVHKNNIYRVKGILVFENEPYEHILQGVGGSFELTEGDRIAEKPESRLVFIGNLKKIEFSLY
ncbi:MAG: GTP-binding protein, partial [Prolixibacteraceae bacterium]